MTNPQLETITFSPNQQALALFSTETTPVQAIIDRLDIPQPRALLILNGGTAVLEEPRQTQLVRLLQEGLAQVVAEERITVITGGTDAGIFQLFGQGMARYSRTAPCIGVTVAALATWPGKPEGIAPLEAHHSHFVLVDGEAFGAETATLYSLAAALAQGRPAVALFAGGGEIATREMQANVAQGRPMILLAGSGRATDGVLAARAGEPVSDERLAEIARFPGIIPCAVEKAPHRLRQLVRRVLFGTEAGEGAAGLP